MFTKKQKRIILISNVVISILIGLISQAPIVNTLIFTVGIIIFYTIDLKKMKLKDAIEIETIIVIGMYLFMFGGFAKYGGGEFMRYLYIFPGYIRHLINSDYE